MQTQTLTVTKVRLPGGREFRAQLYRSPDGEPLDLVLSVSWSGEHGWRESAGTIALPATVLPLLRQALEELERAS